MDPPQKSSDKLLKGDVTSMAGSWNCSLRKLLGSEIRPACKLKTFEKLKI